MNLKKAKRCRAIARVMGNDAEETLLTRAYVGRVMKVTRVRTGALNPNGTFVYALQQRITLSNHPESPRGFYLALKRSLNDRKRIPLSSSHAL